MTSIFGLRFITNVIEATNSEIGLYAVEGENSELRFSEAPLVGVAESWTVGYIPGGGIPPISEAGDYVRGGGPIQYRSGTIRLKNTGRLQQVVEQLGINLSGAILEIIEFDGTEEDSDATFRKVRHTTTCEDVEWTTTEVLISVVSSRDRLRKVNIATDGTPVTFGKSDPDNNRFFKLLRTTAKEKVLSVEDIAGLTGYTGDYYPPQMSLYPVYSQSGLEVTIRIGRYVPLITQQQVQVLAGMYVKFVEGESANGGIFRKIEQVDLITHSGQEQGLILQLRDYTPIAPPGQFDGTAVDQTWVQILDIDRDYEIDTFECKGFEADPVIYAKNESDNILLVPPYGLNINVIGNNALNIDPLHFKDNPNNLSSFIIVPVESVYRYDEPNLSRFYSPDEPTWAGINKVDTGIYGSLTNFNQTFLFPEQAIDKNYQTACEWEINGGQTGAYDFYKVLTIKLPKIKDNQKFTRAYLGITMKDFSKPSDFLTPNVWVKTKGYIARVKNINEHYLSYFNSGKFVVDIDNLPEYYTPGNPFKDSNKNFFRSSKTNILFSGYENFLISESESDYNSIEDVALILRRKDIYDNWQDWHSINNLAVIFETTAEIKEAIYV